MHGAGNDYVYVDCFQFETPGNPAELAVAISDRHKGIGGDGLILIRPSEVADARMQMFNADGSEAEMCGNGLRCVAKYVFDHAISQNNPMTLETGNGVLSVTLETENGVANRIRVDLGEPILEASKIPSTFETSPVVKQTLQVADKTFEITSVSMGNPHCVIFVDQATDELVEKYGPLVENHAAFPNRVNVEFVEVRSRNELVQRTWERGSGETLACGTGAGAVCVAAVLNELTERKMVIHLLGGDLELEWDETSNHVFKTGPAVEVFNGEWFSQAAQKISS